MFLPKMLGPGPGPGPMGRAMGQPHIGPWLGPDMDLTRPIYGPGLYRYDLFAVNSAKFREISVTASFH